MNQTILNQFQTRFGYPATYWVQAPGRVNLIGEHTDYNDGFVLPCAIDYQTQVAAAPRDDQTVRVMAADYDFQIDEFTLSATLPKHEHYGWANYVRGVLVFMQQRGYQLGGMDLLISGNIPQGAGLSSSASLEVVIGQTCKALFKLPITATDIALNGQQAENQFVGCNCGIMDQLISAAGQQNNALLIDCRSLECTPVAMPEDIAVVIINSNVKRGLVDSEYNTRREQCEAAARAFDVKALRDLDMATFLAGEDRLTPEVAARARHVISENQRTLACAQALAAGDLPKIGRLMAESHRSMRDDFAITVPPIDALVDMIQDVIGYQGGVRMTGGGFGGCVVCLVPPALVNKVTATVQQHYPEQTGLQADIYVCHAANGATAEAVSRNK